MHRSVVGELALPIANIFARVNNLKVTYSLRLAVLSRLCLSELEELLPPMSVTNAERVATPASKHNMRVCGE
jgi:hypothetical protein